MRLVRRHGTGISTAQIAAEARCSKETLYNWFDDRDGIFLALVRAQAAEMNKALLAGFSASEGRLEERLRAYATCLLDIMTGDALIVVNRIAMAQACEDVSELGQTVLGSWSQQVEKPFLSLFEEGNRNGTLAVHDSQEAFEALLGLLLGDRFRRLLLGEDARPSSESMAPIAAKAVQRWLILYRI